MTKAALTSNPAPTEGAKDVPRWVSREAFIEAMAPLADLLSLSLGEILNDRFTVTPDGISFATCVPVVGVEPVPHGAVSAAIWSWPVEVQVLNAS